MMTDAQIAKAFETAHKAFDEQCSRDSMGKPRTFRHKFLSEAGVIRICLVNILHHGLVHLRELKLEFIGIWMRFNKRKN